MAKRRANVAPAYIDLGPGLERDGKGRPRSWGGAADVEVVDRIDPDHPNRAPVKAARRRNAVAALLAHGSIEKYQADAAEAFRDDMSLASPSSPASYLGIPVSGKRSDHPEHVLMAIARVRAVLGGLAANNGTVFWWVVVDNKSVREWEDRFKMRHGDGMTLLKEALNWLSEWYDAHPSASDRA